MKTANSVSRPLIVLALATALGISAAAYSAAPDSTDSSATVGAALSDTAITAKVKAKFDTDNRVHGSDISVKTNNGVVTLTGTAKSSSAREAAETLASNVSGVRSVNDQIEAPSAASEIGSKAKNATHRTAAAIEDTAITADLKTRFAADSKTKGSDIDVKTDHSIVALSGTVVSQTQKSHVIYLARHTKGVTQVDSTALSVVAQ